jgi:hypothetical protein
MDGSGGSKTFSVLLGESLRARHVNSKRWVSHQCYSPWPRQYLRFCESFEFSWGIANEDAPEIRNLFHQKYRGSRCSFGYPACPNLEDQTKLFVLLKPGENVGVRLTSGFLLEPEQSTSALVVHHPGAKYFVV